MLGIQSLASFSCIFVKYIYFSLQTIDSLKVTCRKLEEQVQEVMANKESEAKKKIEGDK